jgi:uncharacterized MAPEG superfamily protein
MTTDLWMLVASAALYWVLVLTAATPRMFKNGIPWAVGNRHVASVAVPAWAERAQRACDNMQENLILLVALVLVAHAANRAGERSALGAEIFFGARVLHAGVYIAGVPVVRTVAWAIGVFGLVVVLTALV